MTSLDKNIYSKPFLVFLLSILNYIQGHIFICLYKLILLRIIKYTEYSFDYELILLYGFDLFLSSKH